MLKTHFSNSFRKKKNTLQQGCYTQIFWQLSYSRLLLMTVYYCSTLQEKKLIFSLTILSHFFSLFNTSFFFSHRSHSLLSFLLSLAFGYLSLSSFTPKGKPWDFGFGSEQNQKKWSLGLSKIKRMESR